MQRLDPAAHDPHFEIAMINLLRATAVVLVPVLLVLFPACSSSVTVTAVRQSGIVIDRSIAVDVGTIAGADAVKFRDDLVKAVRSNNAFGFPDDTLGRPFYAVLRIEGYYEPGYEESHYDEESGGTTKSMVEKIYSARFDYRIIDSQTGDLVIDGALDESTSEKEEESTSFFGSILKAVVEAIVSPDPHAPLRERIISRFVAEISPHDRRVRVTLFEDSDMPELKSGIGFARAGRWKDALGLFLEATEKHHAHEEIHKAYYNAGVAFEYTHQYDLAREYLEKAVQISDEDEYLEELSRCRRYEQEWKWREGYLEKLRMMGE